jgi:hypothetical protein
LSIKFAANFTVCLVLASCFPMHSAAQQPTPANSDSSPQQSSSSAQDQTPPPAQNQPAAPAQPPANQDSDKKGSDKDKADKAKDTGNQPPGEQGKVAGTSNDRLFYTLPNFLTLQAKQLPPMSAGDKFKAVAVGNFDMVEFPWWGVLAAISQASNGEPAFGQGWEAYAKRYGITMGDSSVENFMVGAVFPATLREDPRFYESGRGSFWRRSGYAISRMVVTRTDSGRSDFNYSEILGAATAAAISTYTYHPRSAIVNGKFEGSDRVPMNVVSTWGTQLSLDTLTLFVKEFWPDMHRMISSKYRRESAAAAAASESQK